MKILVACEESQRVTIAFRELGHEAFSCDILDCSGGHPEWHIKGDVLPILNGFCEFITEDNKKHIIQQKWDLIIAHPPCTDLSSSGQWAYSKGYKDINLKYKSIEFFMKFINADCEKIAVENPIGIMSSEYRKPDQIIQPYEFKKNDGTFDNIPKSTCLWLKGLPLLIKDKTEKPEIEYFEWIDRKTGKKKRQDMWSYKALSKGKDRGKIRSKTFEGIAKAMAEQWGKRS